MNAVEVQDLSKSYGAFQALSHVNLSVAHGERRAIIGPNGAGKSTLFSIIAGQKAPTSGHVRINSAETSRERPDQIWARGVTRTFQRNQLFQNLSVWDNVELACAARHRGLRSANLPAEKLEQEIAAVLGQVRMLDQHAMRVANLAYGGQRQLELALALAGRPKILLLDEPTAGMSPSETESIADLICALPRDLTILVVEHDMDVVFSIADRIMVLNLGEVLADGTVDDIQQDRNVAAVYMGNTP
jgi:branched-chain amino acid transport system ATP-binding protein